MKQQKFFVGDKVFRNKHKNSEHRCANGDVCEITSVEWCSDDKCFYIGFFNEEAEWDEKFYTIVERAWQENTGVQMVDEDTYIEVLFEGSTSPFVVRVEKDWWECDIGRVKWRIADEYENPEVFSEQEQTESPVGGIPSEHVALGEEFVPVDTQKKNKYTREIKPNVFVDVYDVLRAFDVTDPCLSHLCKKALCAGLRGHKDRLTDLQDIKASIERAIEMHKEWEK